VFQHGLKHFSKVEQHQQERQATSSPIALAGLLHQSHTSSEQDRHSIWGNRYPHPLPLAVTTAHVGDRYCLILSFPTQPRCVHPVFSCGSRKSSVALGLCSNPTVKFQPAALLLPPQSSLHSPACCLLLPTFLLHNCFVLFKAPGLRLPCTLAGSSPQSQPK